MKRVKVIAATIGLFVSAVASADVVSPVTFKGIDWTAPTTDDAQNRWTATHNPGGYPAGTLQLTTDSDNAGGGYPYLHRNRINGDLPGNDNQGNSLLNYNGTPSLKLVFELPTPNADSSLTQVNLFIDSEGSVSSIDSNRKNARLEFQAFSDGSFVGSTKYTEGGTQFNAQGLAAGSLAPGFHELVVTGLSDGTVEYYIDGIKFTDTFLKDNFGGIGYAGTPGHDATDAWTFNDVHIRLFGSSFANRMNVDNNKSFYLLDFQAADAPIAPVPLPGAATMGIALAGFLASIRRRRA